MLDVSTLAIIYHRIQINSFLIIVIDGGNALAMFHEIDSA